MTKSIASLFVAIVLMISNITFVSANIGTTVSFQERVTGTIDTKDDSNGNFYFTVPKQGVVTIDNQFIDSLYRVALFTAGNYISVIDAYDVTENEKITYALKPGQYSINISGLDGVKFGFTLSFEPGEHFDTEPNETIEQGVAIPPNTAIKGFANKFEAANKDVYIVEVPKQQQLIVTKKAAEIDVYDANGRQFYKSGKDEQQFDFNLQPGIYELQVKGDYYEFSYHFEETKPLVEYEPNATIEQAQHIELNTTYTGNLSGFEDREDIYTFTITEPSMLELIMPQFTPNVMLYDANGKALSTDFETPHYQVALKPGTYAIGINAWRIQENIPYTIHLKSTKATNMSLEPNQSVTEAQEILLNEIIYQQTSSALRGDSYYKIDVPADGVLYIENSLWSSGVALQDSASRNIYMHEHDDQTTYSIGVKKGVYYVNISSYHDFNSFKITLKEGTVETESNDAKHTAHVLPLDEKTRGYITYPEYLDVFRLDVEEDGIYHLSFNNKLDSFLNPTVTVQDEDNEVLMSEAFTGRKQFSLKKGHYYVTVKAHMDRIYDIMWQKFPDVKFKDVKLTHPYYAEIMELNKLGIINGFNADTFKPKDNIKRHHVAAMLVRAKAPAIPKSLTMQFTFNDVPKNHSNFMSIHLLAQAGIVNQSATGFKPNNEITRGQMAKMIVEAYDLTLKKGVALKSFNDIKPSSGYYDYVQILASHNITTGSNGSFKPNEPLSRQHFALFLYRTLQVLH